MRGFADFARFFVGICIVAVAVVIMTNASAILAMVGAVVSAFMPCLIMVAGIMLLLKSIL